MYTATLRLKRYAPSVSLRCRLPVTVETGRALNCSKYRKTAVLVRTVRGSSCSFLHKLPGVTVSDLEQSPSVVTSHAVRGRFEGGGPCSTQGPVSGDCGPCSHLYRSRYTGGISRTQLEFGQISCTSAAQNAERRQQCRARQWFGARSQNATFGRRLGCIPPGGGHRSVFSSCALF
jgi:hypothetical protein